MWFWLIVSATLTAVKTVDFDFINEPEETRGIDASVWLHQLGTRHAEEIVKVPLPRFRACLLFRMGSAMVHVHDAPSGVEQLVSRSAVFLPSSPCHFLCTHRTRIARM